MSITLLFNRAYGEITNGDFRVFFGNWSPFLIWKYVFFGNLLFFSMAKHYRKNVFFLLAGLIGLFAAGIKSIRLQFFGKIWYRSKVPTNTIALTFDDGPDPQLTGDILSILKKHAIKVTFFVIGNKAAKNPHLVKQCYDEGHTIACHDLTHSLLSNFRTTKPLIQDIHKTQGIIKNIIGKKPLLYRPPVGLTNPHTHKALQYLHMYCIGWSKSVKDRGNRRLSKIEQIYRLASPGKVILLHDALPWISYKQQILDQIDRLCLQVKKRQIEPVTVDVFFSLRPYE